MRRSRGTLAISRRVELPERIAMDRIDIPSSVLLTGATGFIGSALVRTLLEEGTKVHALALPGDQQRDFIFVDDVCCGLIAAATAPDIEGRVLDLGTGTLRTVREVVERLWALASAKGAVRVGAVPYRPGEVPAIPANVTRTYRLTSWRAQVSLEAGLRRTMDAIRSATCEGAFPVERG